VGGSVGTAFIGECKTRPGAGRRARGSSRPVVCVAAIRALAFVEKERAGSRAPARDTPELRSMIRESIKETEAAAV
jgi:hypothetical protein